MTKSPKYFIQIPISTAKQTDIKPVDKLVFGEVYTMLNTNDKFFMSSKELSKRIGVSRSTVIRSIKRLVDGGYVHTKFNFNNPNNKKRFIYDPNIYGGVKMTQPVVSKRNNRGVKMTQPVVSKRHHSRLGNNRSLKKLDKNIPQSKFEKKFDDIQKYFEKLWTLPVPVSKLNILSKWINRYPYKFIISSINKTANNGIGIKGAVAYTNSILKDAENRPKSPSHNSGRYKPIKEAMPKWSKHNDDGSNHRTDPKLQSHIKKMLRGFDNYDKRHKI